MSTATPPQERSPATVALAGLGAVAVLAALWLFVVSPLLGGDDGEEAQPGAGTQQPAEEPAADPDDGAGDGEPEAEQTAAPDETLPVATYEVFLSRDPFRPVIPEPGAGADGDGTTDGDGTDGDGTTDGDGADGDGTDGDGADGDGTDGDGTDGDGTDGDGTDGDDEGACTGQDEVVCDGRVVSLVDVFVDDDGTPVAVVQVDNELFEVRDGDVFAENFQVMAVDPPCVTLLFGDDSFTLCEGERVLK